MSWRLAVAVLLAANLAAVAWLVLQPDPAAPAPGRAVAVASDAPRLALVAELSSDARHALERPRPKPPVETATPDAQPAGAAAAVPGTGPAGLLCVSLGPFAAKDRAARAAERLRANGIVVELREEAGQLRAGYWVHLPPYPTREAAEAVAEDLKGRGAGELYVVVAADQRHAISLGLFSSPERADQRAAEIGKLGYRPRIAERFREGPVFRLNYREPADQALDVGPLLQGNDPDAQRTARLCQ